MNIKIRCRLFVDFPLSGEVSVNLSRDQAHYLRSVLRVVEGDRLLVFNGQDGEWQALVSAVSKSAVTLDVETCTQPYKTPAPIALLFAPLKKAPTDYLIQKSVELGVTVLQPVMTHRTNSDRVRLDRLLATATEAAEQSTRIDRPQLQEPLRLQGALEAWDESMPLLACAEVGAAVPIAQIARQLRPSVDALKGVGILVGPEGGFSDEERQMITSYPFVHSVGLGPRLLRAETAAAAALSIWQAVAGDGDKRPFFHDGS